MKYISPFREFIYETIRAEDASKDLNAVQTVIDNKRDLGFITLIGSTLPTEQFWEMIDDNNLKTLKVKGNTYQAYIYYRPGAEKKARELRDIAQKYGGYLAWDATEEDSRRIGELLDYDKKDIDAYISKNYKDQ
jgi:hypothetical protein